MPKYARLRQSPGDCKLRREWDNLTEQMISHTGLENND